MGRSPQTRQPKFNTFLTTHVRQLNFLWLTIDKIWGYKVRGSPHLPAKIQTFYPLTLNRYNIFRIDKYKLKIRYDKIWGYRNEGVPLKRGRQNSNFSTTHFRHMKYSGSASTKKR